MMFYHIHLVIFCEEDMSPFFERSQIPDLAYKLGGNDQKWKYVQYKMETDHIKNNAQHHGPSDWYYV
jgi:hypothetical protein